MFVYDIIKNDRENTTIILIENCTLRQTCDLADRIDIGIGDCEALRFRRGKGTLYVKLNDSFAGVEKKQLLYELQQRINLIQSSYDTRSSDRVSPETDSVQPAESIRRSSQSFLSGFRSWRSFPAQQKGQAASIRKTKADSSRWQPAILKRRSSQNRMKPDSSAAEILPSTEYR